MTEISLQHQLITRAKTLAQVGYSTIPVHGNSAPAEPKRPSVSWRQFQRRIATEAEIERGFNEKVTALGIVCGRVSKLLVIDFDDALRYQRFCRHLPQYANTYTVKTMRGFHVYYRTVEKVPSHQFNGGDIKGERSYVVAPPSKIGTHVYRCVRNIAECELGKKDVDQILNYFHVNAVSAIESSQRSGKMKAVDVTKLYRRLAPRIGRNNALYRVASVARDSSRSRTDIEDLLLGLHCEMPSGPGHKLETWAERWNEGKRTISSAYRTGRGKDDRRFGVPNSVRERLLKSQKSTVVARLLDILGLAGWVSESYFTLSEAVRLGGEYGLNRKSVLQALTGDYSTYDGRHIISRRYVEYLDIGGLNVRKRGRPVELAFQVPSVARLLSVMNVRRSPSDCIGVEDVRTAKAYRSAMHREYIQRLSPRSSLRVLAGRLGLNERTIRRYNRALQVKVTACVGCLKLTGEALARLPKRGWRARKNTTNGFWLETGDGSRLPAWRHLGAKLLRAGEAQAQICIRQGSVFSLGDELRPAVQFENVSLRQLARLLVLRGESAGERGLMRGLGNAMDAARTRASALRYEKIQLFFDSVEARVADDKVAETISGYLFASDQAGAEVRRPARRGIAYRMLKEYGNGNVYLALRSSYKEVMLSMARRALHAGDADQGLDLFARSLA
ncbi:MAG: bifunctional DNA primase/polymerase [Chloroflexi bacterium]|nr:bifunctional DNA primase/polymerase [Chloroflexota bacterium]